MGSVATVIAWIAALAILVAMIVGCFYAGRWFWRRWKVLAWWRMALEAIGVALALVLLIAESQNVP
jgi:hypothetical protein